MVDPTLPTPEICALLKRRLQEAEAETVAALKETEPGHPLVEPARSLLAVHREVREMLLDSLENGESSPAGAEVDAEADPKVAIEAVRIEREAHQVRADFKDVLKALFMWKDDPVERVRNR